MKEICYRKQSFARSLKFRNSISTSPNIIDSWHRQSDIQGSSWKWCKIWKVIHIFYCIMLHVHLSYVQLLLGSCLTADKQLSKMQSLDSLSNRLCCKEHSERVSTYFNRRWEDYSKRTWNIYVKIANALIAHMNVHYDWLYFLYVEIGVSFTRAQNVYWKSLKFIVSEYSDLCDKLKNYHHHDS